MIKNNLKEERKNSTSPPPTPYSIAKLCLIIIIVITLSLLAINQFFGWFYKMELLLSPCDLCKEQNPNFEFRKGPLIIEIKNKTINNFSLNPT